MRKLVEDVRQPVSKVVSFYNRSHASTAPAKSFNAFEYSDINLDKAGFSTKPEPAKQQLHQQQFGNQMGYSLSQGMQQGSSLHGGLMQQQRMHIPLGGSMGGVNGGYLNQNYHPNLDGMPASTFSQNYHPNVDAVYRSGGGVMPNFSGSEQPMTSLYRSGGADVRHSFTDRETLA
jgi:hypothetical protein